MSSVTPISGEPSRDEDEDIARVLALAGAGWGIEDIATDIERDQVWVIEALHAHRDCFQPELQQ